VLFERCSERLGNPKAAEEVDYTGAAIFSLLYSTNYILGLMYSFLYGCVLGTRRKHHNASNCAEAHQSLME
jgi:hypothetical protein